ncbi:MAG: YjfB family protein [Hydrogenophilales bacterium]|nr:YjfB family protein [Hydrogenophilales bacterium]
MDIAGNSLNALVNSTNAQQLSVAVLKKALDNQTQAALSLIEAIPQPPSTSGLPPHVGRNINTTA